MRQTTVRVSEATRELLRTLAEQESTPMRTILEKAVEGYRRRRFLERVNVAYTAVRRDGDAWSGLVSELSAWDATLADGLGRERRSGLLRL